MTDILLYRNLFLNVINILFNNLITFGVVVAVLMVASWWIMQKSHNIDDFVWTLLSNIVLVIFFFGLMILADKGALDLNTIAHQIIDSFYI